MIIDDLLRQLEQEINVLKNILAKAIADKNIYRDRCAELENRIIDLKHELHLKYRAALAGVKEAK